LRNNICPDQPPFSNENDSCYSIVFASKLPLRIVIDPGSRASFHS
jgi:hypothetical protein